MYIVVFVTAANSKEAQRIADKLIKDKLIACANIIDHVRSVFWWEGKTDSASEVLLIMKTKKSRLVKIIKTVKSLHSYAVPEIIALPIISGDKRYLRWLDESVR